jgi:hypothetical protein
MLSNVIISEFLASNDELLLDYQDNDSDWIEIQNNDVAAIDLQGWYLTDDATDLTKWQVPASTVVQPGEQEVFFASGSDYIAPNGEQHTNFQLAQTGEYLALVQPDGLTIAHEIAPSYPPQATNASYGITQLVDTDQLLSEGEAGKLFLPTDNTLGTTWTDTFNDAGWTDVNSAVGFAAQGPSTIIPGFTARMIDISGGSDGQLNTTTETLNVFNGNFSPGQYNITLDHTDQIGVVNMGGGGGTWGSTNAYPDGTTGTALEDFAVRVNADIHIPQGTWTIGFGSDDGGFIQIPGINFSNHWGTNGDNNVNDDMIMFEAPRGHAWTRGAFTVGAGGLTTTLDSLFYERGGGDSFEIAIISGRNSGNPSTNTWSLLEDGALGWSVETVGIPPIPDFQPLLNSDIEATMYDLGQSTAFLRVPFDVTDASLYESLDLRMRYDDAFVAYLNGTEVARSNFTGAPSFDSLADSNRSDDASLEFETFDISAHLAELDDGPNVLAIHGINSTADSTGFILSPELIAEDLLSVNFAYMDTPTPGEENGNGSNGIAETPVFSVTSSSFNTSIQLELSVTAPNQTIRYTLDESTPNESSPVYVAPISISDSTQVRAATFGLDLVTSEIKVESYNKLNADLANFSSDLPVIVIDSFDTGIGAGDFNTSSFTLFEPDEVDGRTELTDAPTADSRAGIKVRGSSSAGGGNQKKNFALELWKDDRDDDRNMELLGLSRESDWILHGPDWYDRSLINNAMIYELSNQLGRYAVETRFVEVFVNSDNREVSNSDYFGTYVFMEKIKLDSGRVDIDSIPSQATTEPEISGGYIVKIDRADPGDLGFNVVSEQGRGQTIRYVEPKEEEMLQRPEQAQYLSDYLEEMSSAIEASNFTNPTTGLHYSDYLDVGAFVDHHILNEIMLNVDALRLSAYLYKPNDGLVQAGPVWDFDRAAESNDNRDDSPFSWYQDLENVPYWWDRLFQDIDFRQAWIDRWQELREDKFSEASVNLVVDDMAVDLLESSSRNTVRWGGNYPPRSNGGYFTGQLNGTFMGEIEHKKIWLRDRMNNLDGHFLSKPTFSLSGGIVAANSVVDITSPANSSIYYTLDGSDPRLPGGGISGDAILYTGSITITGTTVFTARTFNQNWNAGINDFAPGNETWSGPIVQAYSIESPPPIRVTEVNYHPQDPTNGELSSDPTLEDDSFEFIEISNVGDDAVNLLGSEFTQGITFQFDSLVLQPGETVLIVANEAAFEIRYGNSLPVVGEYTGTLSNNSERVTFLDSVGTVIHSFEYDDNNGWPERADGNGSTLEVIDTENSYNEYQNWRASANVDGSPGVVSPGYAGDIVINEVLSHTDIPLSDSVELLNTTAAPINIGNWYLSDSNSNLFKYQIPEDTIIGDGEYLVFDEDDFNVSMGVDPNDFALNGAHGDGLTLTEFDPNVGIVRFVDEVVFDAQANAESWARSPDGTGVLYPALASTLGNSNGAPRIGPVVISEIMYNPPEPNNGGSADALEFVELYNTDNADVPLTDWRIRGGIDFDFAPGSMFTADSYLVLVSFDPADVANAQLLADFQAAYAIDGSVTLVGPYTGKLDNGGESVRLQRPDAPPLDEPTFIPRLLEDRAIYDDGDAWPQLADGNGDALARVFPTSIGDYAASWVGLFPSPGTAFRLPTVTGFEFNFGFDDPADLPAKGPQPSSWSNQRSDIFNMQITLNTVVDIDVADITLTNLGRDADNDADQVIQLDGDNFSINENVVTLDFDLDDLTDGVYEIRIDSSVADAAGNLLDGNDDGTAGDDYVFTGDMLNKFYRLKSDFTLDEGVSVFDFTTFSYWFGTSVPTAPAYADMSGDGGISVFDFTSFSQNFGVGVTYPVAFAATALNIEPDSMIPTDEIEELVNQQVVARQADFEFPPQLRLDPQLAELEIEEAESEMLDDVLNAIAADIADIWG